MTLPTLQAGVPIVDAKGAPTAAFLVLWQQAVQGISNSSGAAMAAPGPIVIEADYTGNILTGELPRDVPVTRLLNGTDVSGRSRWFLSTLSGTITATIDQAGVVTVTSLGSSTAALQVKSVRDGLTLLSTVTVEKHLAGTPAIGGTTTSTFNTINSTAHAAITADLSVVVGSSGTINLNAPLDVSTAQGAPEGPLPVFAKWQWFNGASWVDVAAEVQSSPDCSVISDTVPDTRPPRVSYEVNDGTVTANTSKTGLTPGTTQKFHLMARNGSGTRVMSFSGTASAIPA